VRPLILRPVLTSDHCFGCHPEPVCRR